MKWITRPTMTLAILASLAAAPAFAETMTFHADLAGSNEVPPTSSPAKGTLTAHYDTATKVLSYDGTIQGLTGPATAAHFHGPAEKGKNAGVLIPVQAPPSGTFKGQVTLNDAQAKALEANETYFNIHTAANPNGEVRGQVTKTK